MKIPATYTCGGEIDFKIDIDVCILDSRIFTTSSIPGIPPSPKSKRKKYLCFSIELQLEQFDTVSGAAAFARPRLLILLGIMTLLTQELLSTFEFSFGSTSVNPMVRISENDFKFILRRSNKLKDFLKLIHFLNSSNEGDKRLLYSLVDRYRKAIFLESESEENMIHNDEVLLSHFHILELLSTKYYLKQKQKAKDIINSFSHKMIEEVFLLDGNQLQEERKRKNILIESFLIQEISIGNKILFMFNEQALLNHRLKYYILELVKDRNSVAHGREVYKERVIFPIPPFFPLVADINYPFSVLRTLTGRAISIFLGLENLKREWKDACKELAPSLEESKVFLQEKKFATITIEEFYSGKVNDITPWVLSYYFINRKIDIKHIIPAVETLIMNYRQIEDEIIQLIYIVILLVDEVENEFKEKCIDIIKLAATNGWLPDSRMRDLLYYLEYKGHKPIIFREMLANSEIR